MDDLGGTPSRVSAPDGRTYSVRRQWLAWRQRIPYGTELITFVPALVELAVRAALAPVALLLRHLGLMSWELEVRDHGSRWWSSSRVVSRERVRGWGASRRREAELVRELAEQGAPAARFPVVVDRDPVAMGDDGVDHSRTYLLRDQTAPPTISTLVDAIRSDAPWVSVAGAPTTWVLRAQGWRTPLGTPLAVLVLYGEPGRVDVHPVADLSHHVARDGRFHLEYLTTQSVERTLERIASGGSLRDPQA
jgi:hypothetical protein